MADPSGVYSARRNAKIRTSARATIRNRVRRRATVTIDALSAAPRRRDGTCCVRQWSVPSPATSTRQSIGTTRRPGKQRARIATRRVVLRAAEHGQQHGAVRDVEVRVARGQALVLEVLRLRHRQLDDLERPARRSRAHGEQARGSPRAARDSRRARFGSTTVTTASCATKRVRSSTWPSVSSPSMPSPSQRICVTPNDVAQHALDVGARERRVAVRVQQALLGGEQRALAVHLDRAALEHDVGLREARHAERLGHLPADRAGRGRTAGTCRPRRCSRSRTASRCAPHRVRVTKIAPWSRHQASLVGKRWKRSRSGGAAAREQLADVRLVLRVEHVDVDGLALASAAHERAIAGSTAVEHAGPAVAVVRPRQPGGLVRRPLGRHAVAERARHCADRRRI